MKNFNDNYYFTKSLENSLILILDQIDGISIDNWFPSIRYDLRNNFEICGFNHLKNKNLITYICLS